MMKSIAKSIDYVHQSDIILNHTELYKEKYIEYDRNLSIVFERFLNQNKKLFILTNK